MAYVQARPARGREHVEDVELRLVRIEPRLAGIRCMKELTLVPDRLPFRLDLVKGIRFAPFAAHRNYESGKQENRKRKWNCSSRHAMRIRRANSANCSAMISTCAI